MSVRPWPFGNVRPFSQRVIYADPNWLFENYSEAGELKNPNQHYRCMSVEEIAALPVTDLATPDAVLVMWATFAMLPQALTVMKAWGFTYKTGGPWFKQTRTGRKWQFGPGYIFRGGAELFLVGKIGRPTARDTSEARSIRNMIVDDDWLGGVEFAVIEAVREHSRKPDQMIAMIEALWEGPYIELFARTTRPGWNSWGNETDKFEGSSS